VADGLARAPRSAVARPRHPGLRRPAYGESLEEDEHLALLTPPIAEGESVDTVNTEDEDEAVPAPPPRRVRTAPAYASGASLAAAALARMRSR
jgi:hypothetical protein